MDNEEVSILHIKEKLLIPLYAILILLTNNVKAKQSAFKQQ